MTSETPQGMLQKNGGSLRHGDRQASGHAKDHCRSLTRKSCFADFHFRIVAFSENLQKYHSLHRGNDIGRDRQQIVFNLLPWFCQIDSFPPNRMSLNSDCLRESLIHGRI